jgi:hypothetical protein
MLTTFAAGAAAASTAAIAMFARCLLSWLQSQQMPTCWC